MDLSWWHILFAWIIGGTCGFAACAMMTVAQDADRRQDREQYDPEH